jgi:hypothetical protein
VALQQAHAAEQGMDWLVNSGPTDQADGRRFAPLTAD